MDDRDVIHVPEGLAAEPAAEAAHAGVSMEALAEEAIVRHLEARKTLAHFAALRAGANLTLLDRVLSATYGDPPADDDRIPVKAG
jgi:hypothetical protein